MKIPIYVTLGHMGDLEANAARCKASAKILSDMKEDPGIEIAKNGEHTTDLTVRFMYPHTICAIRPSSLLRN